MLIKDLIKELEKLNPNSTIGVYNSQNNFADIKGVEHGLDINPIVCEYIIEPKENQFMFDEYETN